MNGRTFSIGTFVLARVLASILLFMAATMRAYQLSTEYPEYATSLWESRVFLVFLTQVQICLGLWLFVGVYPIWSRIVSLGIFAEFALYSLIQAFIGQRSCGCFGRFEVSPWITFALASLVVALMAHGRPAEVLNKPDKTDYGRVHLFVGLMVLISIPTFVNSVVYWPSSPMLALRRDRRLGSVISMDEKAPTTDHLLHVLSTNTRLRFSADSSLLQLEAQYGRIGPTKMTPWQLMEGVALLQRSPARWDKVTDGYHLRGVAWFGTRYTPWLISSAAALCYYLVVNRKQRRGDSG